MGISKFKVFDTSNLSRSLTEKEELRNINTLRSKKEEDPVIYTRKRQ